MDFTDHSGPGSDGALVPDTISITAPVIAPAIRFDERLQGRSGVYIATWEDGPRTAGYVGSSRRLTQRPVRFEEYLSDLTIITDAAGALTLPEARVLERIVWLAVCSAGEVSLTNEAAVMGARIHPAGYDRLRQFWSACLPTLSQTAGPFGGMTPDKAESLVLLDPACVPTAADTPIGVVLTLRSRGLQARCVETASGRFRLLAGAQVRCDVVRSAGSSPACCVTNSSRQGGSSIEAIATS